MIIKTPEFEAKLYNDLQWININRKIPLIFKGSYKIKIYGDVLTDIDIQCNVHYTQSLFSIIHNIINKNRNNLSPFTFLRMVVGKYEEFKLPWVIDNNGGLSFNVENAKKWLSNIKEKKLVSKIIVEEMEKKLCDSNILTRYLIEIEKELLPYSDIVWEQKDILKGYKLVRGIVYNLMLEMKSTTPVIEYLYRYNNQFINIDFALVDKNFLLEPSRKMYCFYTNDVYKIMKKFRWKLKAEYRDEYLKLMKKVDPFISIKYQVNTIKNLPSNLSIIKDIMISNVQNDISFVLEQNVCFEEIDNELEKRIEEILKDKVEYYLDKMKYIYSSEKYVICSLVLTQKIVT
jgi:hypothetical protein